MKKIKSFDHYYPQFRKVVKQITLLPISVYGIMELVNLLCFEIKAEF
jgi:hypothetical protein